MKKTIPKIGLILISLIVFPTLFFSVYEVKNLNNNEQVIDSIYSSQLSSIVFSLNQYSDDVINSWANSIDNPQNDPLKNDSLVENLIQRNLALKAYFLLRIQVLENIIQIVFLVMSLTKRKIS